MGIVGRLLGTFTTSTQPVTYRDRVFRQASNVVAATRGNATVLMDSKRGKYHTLNEVGARVWDLLAAGGTCQSLAEAIRKEYEAPSTVSAEQVERDIAQLLAHLEHEQLVTSRPPLGEVRS